MMRIRERLGAGTVARTSILDLQFTDHAIAALAKRGIALDDLHAMLNTRHVLTRNRKGRAASHVLIGYDPQGRCIAAPVVPTHDPVVWRIITAWYCKPSEAAKLR